MDDTKDDRSEVDRSEEVQPGSENGHNCGSNSQTCEFGGKCWIAAIILAVIAIIIVGIFFWLSRYIQTHDIDPNSTLGKGLSMVPGAGETFWEATHLVLFGILGFFFPCCDAVIISIGAFWELIEHYFALTTQPVQIPGTEGKKVQWWYGSAVDIAVDIVGFYIGKAIRLTIYPPPKLPQNKPSSIDTSPHCPTSKDLDLGITFFRQFSVE